jgi:DNA-binding NarL/FixJ family response regulator
MIGGISMGRRTMSSEEAVDGRSILIVDDDPLVRMAVKRILDHSGFRVELAQDGLDALNRLHHFVPDLMLLDLDMPGISGLELLHLTAQEGIQPRTVILTAKPSVGSALEAGQMRVVDYFVKPFRIDMVERIRDILDDRGVPVACMTVEERIKALLRGHGLNERTHPTILTLYSSGGSNRAIGDKLNISWSTVSNHIRQAKAVFEVGSRTELVAAIIKEFSKV